MPEKPPSVPGAVSPRPRDTFRVTWWMLGGFAHGARRRASSRAARTYNVATGVLWLIYLPLMWALFVAKMLSPSRRYYMSPERDAVFAIAAKRGAVWQREDHLCARPGTGAGGRLRRRIFEHLVPLIDDAGITVISTAAHERLAQIYCAELPGLVDVGRGHPRGRELRRPPVGPTAAERGRVEQLLEEVAADVGDVQASITADPGPVMAIRRPVASRRGTDPVRIEVPLLAVRRASDDALRWSLAHECAHLVADDLSLRARLAWTGRTLARTAGAAVVALGGAYALGGALLVLLGDGLPVLILLALALALVPLALGVMTLLRWPDVVLQSRRSAWRSRATELRCDLIATRRFGPDAALEALQLLEEWDSRPETRRRHGRYATHPPAELRIAAVVAGDPAQDTTYAAASRLLRSLT